MTSICSVLSIFDKRMNRYPLCIVDEEDFMVRLRLFSNSVQTADNLKMEGLPGEIIRQIAVEQLTSGLTRVKSAADFNLAVKRGTVEMYSSSDIETALGPTKKVELGTRDIGPDTWPPFSKATTKPEEFNPVGLGDFDRSKGSQNPVETPTCGNERRPEIPKQGPYTCSVCNKEFHEMSLLKQHTIRHAVTLPGFCATTVDAKGDNQVNIEMETDTERVQSEAEAPLLSIKMEIDDIDTRNTSERDSGGELSPVIEQSSAKCARKVLECPTILEKEMEDTLIRDPLKDSVSAQDTRIKDTGTIGGDSVIRKKKGARVCTFCPRRFSSISTLEDHLSKHGDKQFADKSFKCNNCGEVYFGERFLKAHYCPEKLYTRPFSCDICDKSFFLRCELVTHKRTHTGEKPFVCDLCDQRCVSKAGLKAHRRVHTGEKPYLCSTCGEGFSHKRGAEYHEILHTGVRAHVCDICGKSFHLEKHFILHKRIHIGEKPHMCDECGRSFLRKKNLTEHLRIHAGVKPYVCQYCGWKFTKKYPLSYHLKSKHKDKLDS